MYTTMDVPPIPAIPTSIPSPQNQHFVITTALPTLPSTSTSTVGSTTSTSLPMPTFSYQGYRTPTPLKPTATSVTSPRPPRPIAGIGGGVMTGTSAPTSATTSPQPLATTTMSIPQLSSSSSSTMMFTPPTSLTTASFPSSAVPSSFIASASSVAPMTDVQPTSTTRQVPLHVLQDRLTPAMMADPPRFLSSTHPATESGWTHPYLICSYTLTFYDLNRKRGGAKPFRCFFSRVPANEPPEADPAMQRNSADEILEDDTTLSLDGKVYAHKAFSNAHTQYHRGRYGTTLLTPNIAVVVAGAVKGILKDVVMLNCNPLSPSAVKGKHKYANPPYALSTGGTYTIEFFCSKPDPLTTIRYRHTLTDVETLSVTLTATPTVRRKVGRVRGNKDRRKRGIDDDGNEIPDEEGEMEPINGTTAITSTTPSTSTAPTTGTSSSAPSTPRRTASTPKSSSTQPSTTPSNGTKRKKNRKNENDSVLALVELASAAATAEKGSGSEAEEGEEDNDGDEEGEDGEVATGVKSQNGDTRKEGEKEIVKSPLQRNTSSLDPPKAAPTLQSTLSMSTTGSMPPPPALSPRQLSSTSNMALHAYGTPYLAGASLFPNPAYASPFYPPMSLPFNAPSMVAHPHPPPITTPDYEPVAFPRPAPRPPANTIMPLAHRLGQMVYVSMLDALRDDGTIGNSNVAHQLVTTLVKVEHVLNIYRSTSTDIIAIRAQVRDWSYASSIQTTLDKYFPHHPHLTMMLVPRHAFKHPQIMVQLEADALVRDMGEDNMDDNHESHQGAQAAVAAAHVAAQMDVQRMEAHRAKRSLSTMGMDPPTPKRARSDESSNASEYKSNDSQKPDGEGNGLILPATPSLETVTSQISTQSNPTTTTTSTPAS